MGAITATLLSVGYDLNQLTQELKKMNFLDFLDIPDETLKTRFLEYASPSSSEIQRFKNLANTIDVSSFAILKTVSNPTYSSSRLAGSIYDILFKWRSVIQPLLEDKDLADGEKIRVWIESKICENTEIEHLTFRELEVLHKKDPNKVKLLYLIGTNISTNES